MKERERRDRSSIGGLWCVYWCGRSAFECYGGEVRLLSEKGQGEARSLVYDSVRWGVCGACPAYVKLFDDMRRERERERYTTDTSGSCGMRTPQAHIRGEGTTMWQV